MLKETVRIEKEKGGNLSLALFLLFFQNLSSLLLTTLCIIPLFTIRFGCCLNISTRGKWIDPCLLLPPPFQVCPPVSLWRTDAAGMMMRRTAEGWGVKRFIIICRPQMVTIFLWKLVWVWRERKRKKEKSHRVMTPGSHLVQIHSIFQVKDHLVDWLNDS